MGPGRLHALVDGVFAIAITLLVLDLPTVPGAADFVHRLAQEWPRYAAYLVSFATIGVIWTEHNGMMSAVRFVNRRFLELTLLWLLWVSIIPWPTSLVAEHIRSGGSAARTVALLYAATMMLMGLSMVMSWSYLSRHERLVDKAAHVGMPAGARRALVGASAYVPALILALIVPVISLAVDAATATYFALSRADVPGLIFRARLAEAADEEASRSRAGPLARDSRG